MPLGDWPSAAEDPPAPELSFDGSVLVATPDGRKQRPNNPMRVCFWDPLTGKENRPSIALPFSCKSWRLSTDGKLLTVFYWNAKIQIWDTATGKELPLAQGKVGGQHMVLVAEKKMSVSADWGYVWAKDLETDKILWQRNVCPPHSTGLGLKLSDLTGVGLSPDRKSVIAVTDCGHLELLDLLTGKPVGFSKDHPGFFAGPLRFLPDGHSLLLNHGASYVLWSLADAKKIRDLTDDYFGDEENLSPDGKLIAAIQYSYEQKNQKQTFKMIEMATGKRIWSYDKDCWKVRFAPDSKSLAVFGKYKSIRFLSAATGNVVRDFQLANPDVKNDPTSKDGMLQELSPEMNHVSALSSDRNSVQLWDTVTGKMLWSREAPKGTASNLSFVPGGKCVAVETAASSLILDRLSGKQLRSFSGRFLAFSADGRFAAVSNSAGTEENFQRFFDVRDVHSGQLLFTANNEGERDTHCAFSPDSRIFACNSVKDGVEFYDLQTKKRLGAPRTHWAYIHQIVFTPGGKALAVWYNDSTVLFWEVPPAPK